MNKIRPSSRDAILEAAFLTFNEKPGASLSDVAERAGVGRATLHRHFNSRQDLMVVLAQTALRELNEAIEGAVTDAQSHTEGLQLALAAMIPLSNRQWFLSHETVEDEPELAESYQKDITELYAEIEAAIDEGGITSNFPTRWIAETYQGLIYNAWSLVRAGEATSAQAADMAWRTFMKGVSG